MIFTLLLSILFAIIQIILIPIDAIINLLIPNMSQITGAVSDFLDIAINHTAWILQLLFINSVIVDMLIGYYAFKLTAPAMAWLLKLMLKWYHAIKG